MELPKEMAPKNTINKTPIMLEILSKGKKMVSVHIHGIAEPVSIQDSSRRDLCMTNQGESKPKVGLSITDSLNWARDKDKAPYKPMMVSCKVTLKTMR